jgi:dipeptidyl aminopeptidase/acylaminoacyl peptidase
MSLELLTSVSIWLIARTGILLQSGFIGGRGDITSCPSNRPQSGWFAFDSEKRLYIGEPGSKSGRMMKTHRISRGFVAVALALTMSLLLLAGCGQGSAAYKNPTRSPGAPISPDKQITMDDLLYSEFVSEMRISPDGRRLAWVKTANTPGQDLASSNLFVTGLADLSSVQLTDFSQHQVVNVRWSPDSSSLAFLTDAPEPGGGESTVALRAWYAVPGTAAPSPVDTGSLTPAMLDWKTPASLIVVAAEPAADTGVDDTVHVSEVAEPAHLYEVPVKGGAPRKVTDNNDNIIQLRVSPNGGQAFMVRTRGTGVDYSANNPPSHCYLVDLASGRFRQVLPTTTTVLGASWAPDSSRVYVVENHSSNKTRPLCYRCQVRSVDPSNGKDTLLDLSWGRGLDNMSPFGYTGPVVSAYQGGFAGLLADGYHPKVAMFSSGSPGKVEQQMVKGQAQGNIFALALSADGRTICYEHSTATKPVQLYVARLENGQIVGPRQITRLNPQYDNKQVSRAETITWKGALDEAVEGLLYYPVDYQPGKKYPLVLMIHGGPFESDKDRWAFGAYTWVDPYRLMNQKGAFALSVNYHGSASYGKTSEDWGDSMADSLFYGYALQDLEAAIDDLVTLGMVDPNRLATAGWSGGGMLSNGLIATDARFKAASCGAGGAEWVSMWGPCEFGDAIARTYFGVDPVEDPSMFKDPNTNPFYDAGKVKTPTIMFTGDADVNVPASMTWVTYRGIQQHGKAPVELFIAPGEPHVYLRVSHQQRKMVEEQKWFDKYLFSGST